ncbi:hypothetical protein VMCG_03105 [Cytospora schulzeri]|uniref:Uncharacterized protein n=1 Tax=Cytospora schulzeri TaxID=448051 RepID=A0A423WY16_9PEZI|nr:hypothetical protein VMCG_03105 [Valsa malicola]
MAPSNAPTAVSSAANHANPTSFRQNSASRPLVRKRIEPVIPLPYLQRRPKQPPASTQLPSPLRTNSEDAPPNSDKGQAQPSKDEVKGLSNGIKPTADSPAPPQNVEQEETGIANVGDDLHHQEPEPVSADTATQSAAATHQPTAGEVTPPGMSICQTYSSNNFSQPPTDNAPSAPSPAPRAPPAVSPTTYDNMAPPFYPVNNHPVHFRGPIPEPLRMPQHALNGPRMHQQHPSNGSMVFGGFHGSNTSSPAPRSGGAFPPPLPMAHEQMPVAAVDAFGRPMVSVGPIDGHASVAMNHGGPMTPHSYHESHSSWNPEDSFAPKPLVNGHNGVDLGRLGPPPGVSRVPQPPPNQPPFNPDGFEVGDAMGFTEQISSMFARPDFADCQLCLVLPDYLTSVNSQHPDAPNGPLRLPAHKLILSTNRVLRNLLQEQAGQADELREIRIASDDPFLRADSMWRAVKHVYGCRYVPFPMGLQRESDVEKFHFALGYAAAGALLEVPHISINAMVEASRLLSWDTVEKGLEFVLRDSVIAPSRMDGPQTPLFPQFQYKHGIYVNELVEKIMMFIITNFPSNFVLDTSVDDPRYSRFPASPTKQSAAEVSSNNAAPVGQLSSRLSSINIRFGDMDPSENNGRGQPAEQQHSDGYRASLSRILLNLPFEMVKFLLESNGVGGVSGWQTVQDRRRVIPSVIAQREYRRKEFISRLKWDRWQQDRAPTEGLASEDPQLLESGWNSVCWEEQCMPNAEMPVMDRGWKPLGRVS